MKINCPDNYYPHFNLGMAVTAEGVETTQQLAHLRALKCEFGQGYFFQPSRRSGRSVDCKLPR